MSSNPKFEEVKSGIVVENDVLLIPREFFQDVLSDKLSTGIFMAALTEKHEEAKITK